MSGRVTKRRTGLPPLPREDLEHAVRFWRWLCEAADKAVDRYLNRPRIGDTRPSTTAAVFKPRQHFNLDGTPKAKLTKQQAQSRCAGDERLNAYHCSICREWHVGHRKAVAA